MLEFRESRTETGALRLTLLGELDIASSPFLRARLDALAESGQPVDIDLSELTFIDARGIAVLVAAVFEAREDGWPLRVEPKLSPKIAHTVEHWGASRYFWPDDEPDSDEDFATG